MEKKFARDNIPKLTAVDMTDAMYGAIQSLIEGLGWVSMRRP